MNVLLQHLWPALAISAVLGLGFTLVFGTGVGLPSARWEVRIAALLALLVGALVAFLGVVPGRAGLWLDIGTLCVLAYAVGTGIGAALRRLAPRGRRVSEPLIPTPPSEKLA